MKNCCNNFGLWCYKILPLVYDESLSYYEVLCKMKEYINKMGDDIININNEINNMDSQLAEIVGEWLNENFSIPFYNVVSYGILPDDGDVYEALHGLIKNTVSETGGIVFFPEGKYTISCTIFVPENTIFCGCGEGSEIFFDETDTYYGTCLSNGGSNVSIYNLKVSHASEGTFHSGSQPGAIGFSDWTIRMCKLNPYQHKSYRGEVRNLEACNIYCDGNYCLQVENSASYAIKNVDYENIYSPIGCVSIQANNLIENVSIKNVECDLLRVLSYGNNSSLYNIEIENVECTSLYVNAPYSLDNNDISFKNVYKNNNERHNDYYDSTYIIQLRGDVTFDDCLIDSRSGESAGLVFYDGIKTFNNCKIVAQDLFCTNNQSFTLSNKGHNHCVFNDCVFESNDNVADPTIAFLIGYGKNNNYENLHNYRSYLWGDMHNIYKHCGFTNASDYYPSGFYVEGDTLYLRGFFVVADADDIGEFSDGAKLLPITNNQQIQFIETSTSMTNQTYRYGKLTDGVITANATLTESAFLVDTALMLDRTPDDYEIVNGLI